MTDILNLLQNVTPLNRRFIFLGGTGIYIEEKGVPPQR